MNLKRGFLALAAMILGVGFLGAFPQQAHAVTLNGVTCNLANDSSTLFPHNQLWNCAPAGQGGNINEYRAVLRQLGSDAETVLDTSHRNAQFYLFQHQTDYFNFCTGGSVIPCDLNVGDNTLGRTIYGSPTFTIVFVRYGPPSSTIANPEPNNTEGHEAGHHLDRAYVTQASGTVEVSDSAIFNAKLDKDWDNINATAPCGGGGVFNGQKNSSGTFICSGGSLIAPYDGMADNEARLKALWPVTFNSNAEIFARQVGAEVAGPLPGNQTSEAYLGRFDCSNAIQHSLRLNGTMPSSYPTGCN